jgi:hypothetical protein
MNPQGGCEECNGTCGGAELSDDRARLLQIALIHENAIAQSQGVVGGGPYQIAANVYRKLFGRGRARPLLEGEYHYGLHNFTGPGTRIDLPEVRNFKPYNDIDDCSKQHDIAYLEADKLSPRSREAAIRQADIEAVDCYNKYPSEDGYNIARLGISGKMLAEDTVPGLVKAIAPKYFGKRK